MPAPDLRLRCQPMTLAIGVDVGGTKIAAGVVDDAGNVIDELRSETPATDVEATELAIVELVAELRRQARHLPRRRRRGRLGRREALGRLLRAEPGLARRAPRRGAQRVLRHPGRDRERRQRRRLGRVPLRRRDRRSRTSSASRSAPASAAAWSSAARSTAVGSASRRSSATSASSRTGCACPCGNHGCWEMYASGRALVRSARAARRGRPGRAETLLSLGNGTPEGIQGVHVTAAAEDGDTVALDAFAGGRPLARPRAGRPRRRARSVLPRDRRRRVRRRRAHPRPGPRGVRVGGDRSRPPARSPSSGSPSTPATPAWSGPRTWPATRRDVTGNRASAHPRSSSACSRTTFAACAAGPAAVAAGDRVGPTRRRVRPGGAGAAAVAVARRPSWRGGPGCTSSPAGARRPATSCSARPGSTW